MKRLILALLLLLAQPVFAGSPVLLTFDVEKEGDKERLKELNIQVPATYFVLGAFAEKELEFIKELSTHNSIGSHAYSHNNLTGMSYDQQYLELKSTKMILEDATGRPVTWFRAPFLESNNDTIKILKELDFTFISPGGEWWMDHSDLFQLPVSVDNAIDRVASDFNVFEQEKISDEDALNWYKQQYLDRAASGRPLVLLFHPYIIHQHQAVLQQLIAFIQEQGGQFITADQWAEKLRKPASNRVGVWIDLTVGSLDADQIVNDLTYIGTTDAFLMVKDYDGYTLYAKDAKEKPLFDSIFQALKQHGIKVHAWLPSMLNPREAQLSPEIALVDSAGNPSVKWMAPSNIRASYTVTDQMKELLHLYEFDGVHLDYIRYPGLEYDFTKENVEAFAKTHNLKNVTKEQLLSKYYKLWTDWRSAQITEIVRNAHEVVHNQFSYRKLELSASLIADASVSFKSRQAFGQDYSKLAKYLDTIVPMAYFKNEKRPIEWLNEVVASTRYWIGDKNLLMGLAAYQTPDKWTVSNNEFEKSVEIASKGSNGIALYDYSHLFGKGEKGWNSEDGNVQFLHDYYRKDTAPASPAIPPKKGLLSPATVSILWEGLVLIGLGLVILWHIIRRKQSSGIRLNAKDTTHEKVELDAIDFKALEEAITSGANINADIFQEVSKILKAIGPQNISRFRRIRLLELVQKKPVSLTLIQKRLASYHNDMATLRRVEEAGMLGYVEIDSKGMVSITDAGRTLLEEGKESGYNRELINFVDRRLIEHLIIDCVKCSGKTIGHWFWQNYECSECHHKTDVIHSPNIALKR